MWPGCDEVTKPVETQNFSLLWTVPMFKVDSAKNINYEKKTLGMTLEYNVLGYSLPMRIKNWKSQSGGFGS